MLQCVAVFCSVLQCNAMCVEPDARKNFVAVVAQRKLEAPVLQFVAVSCSAFWCVAVRAYRVLAAPLLQCVAVCGMCCCVL